MACWYAALRINDSEDTPCPDPSPATAARCPKASARLLANSRHLSRQHADSNPDCGRLQHDSARTARHLSADPAFQVLAEATDGLEAVRLAQELNPDVVLMEVRMPTMNGLAATAAILRACPEIRAIILASVIDEAPVLEAVRVGAAGFLLKKTPDDELCQAVRRAAGGEVQLAPQATAYRVRHVRAPEQTRTQAATRATRMGRVPDA